MAATSFRRCFSSLAAVLFASFAILASAGPLVAGYDGTDDREDIAEVPDALIRENARSVAAILSDPAAVNRSSKTHITLREFKLSERLFERDGYYYPLCPGERFLNQLYGVDCTGFLIAPQVVATAGHCAAEEERRHLTVVFDLQMDSSGKSYDRMIPRSRTYRAEEVVLSKSIGDEYKTSGSTRWTNGRDWAYIRLDAPVCDRPVLARKSASTVAAGQDIYMIGHPQGLPLKFAPGQVSDPTLPQGFLASIDAYTGNSGSPVFNASDHSLEGVYTSGPSDRDWDGANQCFTTKCTTCRTENVLRVSMLPDPALIFPGRLEGCGAAPSAGSKAEEPTQDEGK